MKLSWGFGLIGATFVVAGALSCSSDRRSESIAHSSQALSVTDRVLSFEQVATDWTPVDGTIVSSDLHVDGAHSGAFTVTGWNAQLVSPKLAPLGPIGSTATLELELPANLNGQSWQGQISLAVDAPSAGVYSQHTSAVQFQSAPVGSFQHIQFTLAPAVVSALSAATVADLQFTLIFGMAPNAQPFLVDKLNFGQGSQSDGGTDAGSMTGSGATGTGGGAGSGGASGGTSAGGGGIAGSAGASGGGAAGAGSGGMSGGAAAAGTGGGGTTAGTSGPCDFNAPSSDTPATNINFTIKLPHGVHREDVAIATENGGFFRLDDGVRVVKDTGGFASLSSLESIIRPELGVSAEAQDLYSEPTGIDLRSNAHVHGIVKTAANLAKQAGAIVDGSVSENTSLQPFDTIEWTEAFPDINRGSCSLEPDSTEIIDPGSYGAIAIKSRSHLKIRSGKYYFSSLSFEPGSVLDIDNTAGPVFIYVRTDFAFGGTVVEADPTHMNFLFGVAGANDISIQSPFRGILVAPLAGVNLPTEGAVGHVGSFFMRAVIAHQNTLIHQRPFLPSEFCATDAACSSFCPCDAGMRTCTADSQCKSGLVCGLGNGRRFDQPGGSSVCWDPRCNAVPATLACGAPTSACGRCTDAPPTCVDDSDCASGEVCGAQNSGRFGEAAGADVCWPAICSTQPNSPGNCGSTSAACGACDCSATCAAKHCGDDPADGCGGFCPGLCGPGQAGCTSDLDCAAGTVCGQGVGDRFGLPAGSNVCWASTCALQDPSKPNCGVGSAQCGACPACIPQCSAGSTGPDGCGGSCGECAGLRFHGMCINQSLVDSPPFPVLLPPAEPTHLVGTLPGSFQVTDRGTASYSIPIAVPPGRMGMEPDLSLRYSSTKANGMLGMGWSLGGLSSITRCPSILDREGGTQPVKLDATDHFCLDGQALIQISSSTQAYGDDGAEYRTEIDSFRKITSHRTGSVLAAGAMLHGPDSFEVRTKDGRILTYGGTDDSVAVPDISPPVGRVWALSKVMDRSGNAMQVSYIANRAIGIGDAAVQHDGIEINLPGGTPDGTVELVPKLISYGEVSGSPSRFVAFNYDGRPDVQKHFSAGVAGYSTQRLTAIETFVGGPARTYHIDYEADGPDHESRVMAIRECSPSANGEVCMPATQFSYSEFHDPMAVPALGSLQIQTGRSGTLQHCLDLAGGVKTIKDPNGALAREACFVDFAPVLRPSIITGDFNGDGLDDVLGDASVDGLPESYANGLWTLALSRGDGTFAVTSSPELVGGLNPTNRCISQESVMDVNRDGMADLVYLCVDAGVGSGTLPASVFIATGTGFTRQDLGFSASLSRLKIGDVDGNGLRDFVACNDISLGQLNAPTPTSFTFSVALNTPSGIRASVNSVSGQGSCANLSLIDIDSDGDDDIVEFSAAGSLLRVFDWSSRSWVNHGTSPGLLKDIKLLDMNGDGLKDVIVEEPFSVIYPTPSTGILSQTFHLWMNSGLAIRPTSVSLTKSVDLGHVPAPDPLHVSRAQPIDYDGDGREELVFPAGILHLTSPDQLEFTSIDFGYDAVTVADINGDSSPDLIEIKNGNEAGTDPAAFGRTLTIRALGAARAGLLQTITDGYGKRISVRYDARVRSPIAGDGGPPPVVAVYQTNGCAADSLSSCIQRVGPLVSAHDEAQVLPDGRTNEGAQYRYFYFGARAGLGGRGWFGFSSRDIIQTQAPDTDTSITYNNHDFALAGTVSSVQKIYFGSADANQFTNPVSFRSELSTFAWSSRSGDFTQFPVVNTETHAIFEGSATQPLSETRIDSTIDQFGTATSTTVATTAGNGPTTLIASRDVNNDTEDWLLGQVSSVRTISLRDGLSATRTSHFTYEPGTNLISTIERQPDPRSGTGPDPDAPSEYQKTTFTREPNHGNVREVCISAAVPVAARCASVTAFDAADIFPTHTTDAMGLPSEAHFSPVDGKLIWGRDANGLLTELGRDAFGRVVSVLSPTQEGTITYASSSGRTPGVGGISIWSAYSVTETFKGHGSATKFFDAFGNHTDTVSLGTDSKLIVSEREFDSTGHLRKAAAPHSAGDTSQGLTEYVYDGFGRLSSATDAVGSTTRYAYPNRMTALAGAVSSWFTSTSGLTATAATVVQKPRGNFEAIVRDPSGNPVASAEGSLADSVKPITRFRYHPFDVLFEIDSLSTTTIQSDGLGRVRQVDDPATGTQVSSYDGFDELIEYTSGNQNKTIREYDSDGRPTRLNDQNGALIAQWLYDGRNPDGSLPSNARPNALGRLTATYRQARPGAATGNWVGYQYQAPNANNRGLLESIDYGISGDPDDPSSGAQHFSIGFEYKADVPGQIDVVHYPEEAGGLQVQYNYAVSGAISSVFPAGDPTHPYWKLLELDQGFRPKTEALGNGLVTTRDYYSLTNGAEECAAFTDHSCLPGRLRAISIQKGDNASVFPIQNDGYAYDRNGNLASITPSLAPIKELYEYDQFDRLVAHREQNPSPVVPTIEAFTYDSIGNLTSKTGVGSFTYGKPGRPFQVTEAGGVTYGYDNAGNQTTRSGTSIPGGSQTLEYNDFNMPYRITSGDNGAAGEVDFEYAAGGSRLVKRKLAGGNPSETTFDIADLYEQVVHYAVGQAEPIDRTHLFRIFAGRQIAQVSRVERAGGVLDDPKIVYLHDDHIGSTRLITDANGAVIDGRSYGSFGDETSAIDYAATGVLSGFTSQEHDADLGLVNMRGRLYDPRLGRFITPDPFVTRLTTQGFNRYSYVRNNPLTLVDPSGFWAECSYPGACGEDPEERAREEGEARGEEAARAASEAAAQAAAAEHACDGGLCGGQAPNTLTDPTSNPGARSARDAELNWTAGNQGNPFQNPNRLAINTIDDEQGGIGSGGLPTAEIEGMGEAAGPGALDNLGEIVESVGKSFDDLFNAVERFIEELEQPKLGPRQAYVDAAGARLGDLTAEEVEQIQSVVDEAGRPLEVVGSAARGGRNPASDIDYTTANANHQEFGDLTRRLPGIDPDHGLLRGGADPYEGPAIRFEPGEPPRFVPAASR